MATRSLRNAANSAVIAAAYFAVKSVGGLPVLVAKVGAMHGPADHAIPGFSYLDVLPAFAPHNSDLWDLAVAVFIMPIAVQWWAVWYPGAEPGGGSYIAQRMLASKSEKDALGGTLFFNVAHYVLRPWPWILVGLASIIVYPELSDIQKAFPHLDPKLIGHDIAYPAMLRFLPAGWVGLMLGGLIAANSSTILTHLNWGASYLVHDFYRRFVKRGAPEKHYVVAGRLASSSPRRWPHRGGSAMSAVPDEVQPCLWPLERRDQLSEGVAGAAGLREVGPAERFELSYAEVTPTLARGARSGGDSHCAFFSTSGASLSWRRSISFTSGSSAMPCREAKVRWV